MYLQYFGSCNLHVRVQHHQRLIGQIFRTFLWMHILPFLCQRILIAYFHSFNCERFTLQISLHYILPDIFLSRATMEVVSRGSIHDNRTNDDSVQDNSCTHDDNTNDDSTHDDSTHDDSTHDDSTHDDSVHDDSAHDDSVHDDSAHADSTRDDSNYDDNWYHEECYDDDNDDYYAEWELTSRELCFDCWKEEKTYDEKDHAYENGLEHEAYREIKLKYKAGYQYALMHAAYYGHTDCISWCLQHGASVHTHVPWGERYYEGGYKEDLTDIPFLAAIWGGKEESIRLLLSWGADINQQDMNYCTALTLAAGSSNPFILELLIKAGGDVNTPGGRRKTPLMIAESTECVKLLLEAGAHVNLLDDDGRSALMGAARLCCPEVVELLLRAGADVHRKGRHDVPLTAVAAFNECHAIGVLKCLLKNGVRINNVYDSNLNTLREIIVDERYPKDIRSIKNMCHFLFAAGETLDGDVIIHSGQKFPVPRYLLHTDKKLDLKHLCREAIRKHLLKLNPHTQLFSRVPKFGLPWLIEDYLLYGESLEPDGSVIAGVWIKDGNGYPKYEYVEDVKATDGI